MRSVEENERKSNSSLGMGGAAWYKKKINDMIKLVDDERFLRRIYIIISDNEKEKPE